MSCNVEPRWYHHVYLTYTDSCILLTLLLLSFLCVYSQKHLYFVYRRDIHMIKYAAGDLLCSRSSPQRRRTYLKRSTTYKRIQYNTYYIFIICENINVSRGSWGIYLRKMRIKCLCNKQGLHVCVDLIMCASRNTQLAKIDSIETRLKYSDSLFP